MIVLTSNYFCLCQEIVELPLLLFKKLGDLIECIHDLCKMFALEVLHLQRLVFLKPQLVEHTRRSVILELEFSPLYWLNLLYIDHTYSSSTLIRGGGCALSPL